jgi:aerobic-type carbon monoxide dehydrogenase small subunit (CoxS/CutS family)
MKETMSNQIERLAIQLNGEERYLLADPLKSLAHTLRDQFGCRSVKIGCEQGGCGSCSVLLNDRLVLSCLVPMVRADGARVQTVEGLSKGNQLDPIQESFIRCYAAQCGFCTSGMIMSAKALLDSNLQPTREDVVVGMSGNICRCTGYLPIIDAVLEVARGGTELVPESAASGKGPCALEKSIKVLDLQIPGCTGEPENFKEVGKSVPRRDLRGHVTGRTAFVEDALIPGLRYMKIVRSPHHHARILRVDLSEARRVPGLIKAITHQDVPNNFYTILRLIGVEPNDEPVLADDRVLYRGEPIVAIVGESPQAAAEAARQVKIDFEPLEPVFDVEEALKPEAPRVARQGVNHFIYEGHHCRRVRFGNVADGFAAADRIIEQRYDTSPIEHAALETTGCIAKPESDGRVTVYTNTQALFFSLDNTALILGVPPNRLHFVGGTVGGGFGGKVDVIVEPLATLAAMLIDQPVKYFFSREEEMQVSSTRAGERFYFKDGVLRDGRIIARQVRHYMDAGAYARHTPYAATKAAAHLPGPYAIPNVYLDCHCVYTNHTPTSAFRGFGVTWGDFAIESQMDLIANRLGLDPWHVRLRNAYRDGDIKAHRKRVSDAALVEVIQAAARIAGKELDPAYSEMTSFKR